jgi:hypothetical protein
MGCVLFDGGKVMCSTSVFDEPTMSKSALKILLNLVLIGGDALIRGGRLDVGAERHEKGLDIVVRAEGPRIVLDPELKSALSGQTEEEALGYANDVERTTWSHRPIRPLAVGAGSFGPNEIAQISPRRGEDPTLRLLAALRDIVGKVNPPELDRWNVSNRDRVSNRSSHPLRQVTERAANAFGVHAYELYVHGAHQGLVEVELTDPVSILVPSHVAALTESEQAFLISRAMANVARGIGVVDRLAPAGIELLLAAAARLVEPSFASGRLDEEYLASLTRRVSKSLPWIGRGPIEDAARSYADAPRLNPVTWTAEARLTAARAALIVADDLPSSIALVRRLEGDLAGIEGESLAEGTQLTEDLLRFWVSDTAFTLQPMERLAQLVIVPVVQAAFNVVADFPATQRGAGGYGSTGKS